MAAPRTCRQPWADSSQEAPCPEALSPSPLRPALPLPGTPSRPAGGRVLSLHPFSGCSFLSRNKGFLSVKARRDSRAMRMGKSGCFIDGGNIQTPRLGARAWQGPRPGCVLPLGAPRGELLLQLLPRAFIHLLKFIQRICKRRRRQKKVKCKILHRLASRAFAIQACLFSQKKGCAQPQLLRSEPSRVTDKYRECGRALVCRDRALTAASAHMVPMQHPSRARSAPPEPGHSTAVVSFATHAP